MSQRPVVYKNVSVKVTDDHKVQIKELARRFDCNQSEVMRRALDELWSRSAPTSQELVGSRNCMQGPEEVQDLKWQAVDLFREHKGPAMVARELGLTRRTIGQWIESDPLFKELSQEARDHSVEQVEQKMWAAAKDGNIKSQFGILNSNHEGYGLMRRDYIEKGFKKALQEVVIPLVRRYLQPEVFKSFSTELRTLLRQHFS